MKMKHAAWAAAALVVSVPAFAQTAVQSSGGAAVSSGTGVVVTPGAPSTAAAPAATVATPAVTVVAAPTATISGAVVAQAGSPSETVSGNTRTIVTRYWVNVPAGVERDADFQRWQRLK